MVASIATPTAVAQAAPGVEFSDLAPANAFYDEIHTLVQDNIMSGFTDGTVRANVEITRAQAAKIIANALDLDTTTVKDPNFDDVGQGNWHYGYVAALKEIGVIKGDSNGTVFRPKDTITRAELAAFITRGFEYGENPGLAAQFDDVSNSNWYAGYVGALKENGVTRGKTATKFAPHDNITRGEVAAFVSRSIDNQQAQEQKGTIDAITATSVDIDGTSYQLSDQVKSILHDTNRDALENAVLSFETDDSTITKVTSLEITSSGQDQENPVVLNGQDATIDGNLKVNADYVTVKNLTVKGNVELAGDTQQHFNAENVTVEGTTIISSQASIASVATIVNNTNQSEIIFANSSLQDVEISKKDSAIELKDNTSLAKMAVSSNATIQAPDQAAIPEVNVKDGAEQVELNAAVTDLSIDSRNNVTLTGETMIDHVRVTNGQQVSIDIKGTIKDFITSKIETMLNFGFDTKVDAIEIPENTRIEDIVKNFNDIKGNIGEKQTSVPDIGGGSPTEPEDSQDGDETAPVINELSYKLNGETIRPNLSQNSYTVEVPSQSDNTLSALSLEVEDESNVYVTVTDNINSVDVDDFLDDDLRTLEPNSQGVATLDLTNVTDLFSFINFSNYEVGTEKTITITFTDEADNATDVDVKVLVVE